MFKGKRVFLALALVVPMLGACVSEPRVLVIPDEGSPLDSGAELASTTDNFEQDFVVQREEIVLGQVFTTSRFWYLAEVKNTSQTTVYTFRANIDAFDQNGSVRGANVTTPDIEVLPGETVVFLERIGDNLFASEPTEIASFYKVTSARAVQEGELAGLSLESIDWAVDTDYFGDRDFVVSGEVRNETDSDVSHFRVDAWCQNESGQIFAMPSQAFFGGNEVLAPGSSIPFITDMYTEIDMTVDDCTATIVKAGPKEYGPGVTVNDLRDASTG